MSEPDAAIDRRARAVLRNDSDRLLRAVEELKALEREKRLVDVSSEPFHELARQVELKAREVFRLADQQERDGSLPIEGGTIEDAPDE